MYSLGQLDWKATEIRCSLCLIHQGGHKETLSLYLSMHHTCVSENGIVCHTHIIKNWAHALLHNHSSLDVFEIGDSYNTCMWIGVVGCSERLLYCEIEIGT